MKFCIVCGRNCDPGRDCFVSKEDVKKSDKSNGD